MLLVWYSCSDDVSSFFASQVAKPAHIDDSHLCKPAGIGADPMTKMTVGKLEVAWAGMETRRAAAATIWSRIFEYVACFRRA